jgi:hypothetical protein
MTDDDDVGTLIEQVRTAINGHDLDTFLDSFDEAVKRPAN